MDKIEALIRGYFESHKTGVSGRRDDGLYPSSEILVDYLTDKLQDEELERMMAFLRGNPEGQALVSKARELLESEGGWEKEEVPAAFVDRAKKLMPGKTGAGGVCPHCGKSITPFRKGRPASAWKCVLWFAFCAVFFALSFALPRYFYQCLAAALLCGFKGIVDQRAAKTQIMIYKALSDEPGAEHQRLHQHSSRL